MTANMLQPTLIGKLVRLRPVRKGDWAEMFKVASDPNIWAGHSMRERYKENEFRQYFSDALKSASALSIVDMTTDEIIGASRYHDYKPNKGEIEIGWTFLACEYWGGKYNAETKALMLQHAFSFVDVVVFWVAKENLRSHHAMQKIGGILRAGEYYKTENGHEVPYVVFEIQKENFPSGALDI